MTHAVLTAHREKIVRRSGACNVARSFLEVMLRIQGLTAPSSRLIHPVLHASQMSPHKNESKVCVLASSRVYLSQKIVVQAQGVLVPH